MADFHDMLVFLDYAHCIRSKLSVITAMPPRSPKRLLWSISVSPQLDFFRFQGSEVVALL